MPDIITVGEILVEVMRKKIGQTFLEAGDLIGPFASGAPAICMDQAARMGASCGIISKVGDDDFGRMNVKRLKDDGVDVSQIKISPEYTTGTAFVTYFEDGSRQFIYHFKHSAAGHMQPEDVCVDYLDGCKFFHVMGCSISATESMRETVLKAARAAKQKGAKITFDPNLRQELLENEKVKTVFDEMLGMTDILMSGKSELRALLGMNDIDAGVRVLQEKGIRTIVLKDGARGVEVLHDGENIRMGAYSVEEVDPTGAGDCFDGAFLACLTEDKGIMEAAKIATAAGALSVSRKGPMEGACFREDVLSFASGK